ncbi:G-type lectin S-receptor-like serine/threonine-protein kinase CES101 [Prunus yedoensis var. nudiflora]|uniref:G-type lectin S-receptor-like serine/threonine-protein kinase CES101 n=1 Tax=Prunus yedoensis var. nudiflora TaxID=2094558 RepID=A0A314ZHW0_PRUYE|nr:G-type lectin S-receptor-like serine/threonine-protein kinase CES101 [Prunus yedoensis var. nudiflora]
MKLGVDHINEHVWSLLSWGSRDNPVSSGPFSLDWDTNAHQLKIKKSGVIYWTSGVFADGRFEYILPDVSKQSLDDPNDPEPEWVLYTRGALFEYGAQVDIIRAQNCDGYNTVGGCVRRDRPSNCVGKLGDDFEIKKGYFKIINSANASRPANWIGTGSEDCKVTCWQNCDCLGFDFPFGNQTTGAGCRFWSVDCAFIENLSTATHSFVVPNSVTLPPKSPDSPPRGKINKGLWIGTSIAALLVIGFCILCYRLRGTSAGKNGTKTQKKLLKFMKSERPTDHVIATGNIIRHPDLSIFTYECRKQLL